MPAVRTATRRLAEPTSAGGWTVAVATRLGCRLWWVQGFETTWRSLSWETGAVDRFNGSRGTANYIDMAEVHQPCRRKGGAIECKARGCTLASTYGLAGGFNGSAYLVAPVCCCGRPVAHARTERFAGVVPRCNTRPSQDLVHGFWRSTRLRGPDRVVDAGHRCRAQGFGGCADNSQTGRWRVSRMAGHPALACTSDSSSG